MGLVEFGGKLRGAVEPEEADEDLGGGSVGADFEDVGGPEGGDGKVVPGYGDGVVEVVRFAVGFVFVFGFDWVRLSGRRVSGG